MQHKVEKLNVFATHSISDTVVQICGHICLWLTTKCDWCKKLGVLIYCETTVLHIQKSKRFVEKGCILTENEMAHTFYLQLQSNSDIILSHRMIIIPTCDYIVWLCAIQKKNIRVF